jgi:hypothetical protein
MSIFNFFRRSKPRGRDAVNFTDNAIRHVRADGAEETIRWDDLHEVSIVTTDAGPFNDDVFWLLVASDGKSGCAVPGSSDGSDQLLKRLQQLPGFDNEALIKAMSSTSNAKFICWKRLAA